MRPIDFKEANITYTSPRPEDDEILPIRAQVTNDGMIITCWQPNKEDIEAINAGRPILLLVYAQRFNSTLLLTLDEEGEPNV